MGLHNLTIKYLKPVPCGVFGHWLCCVIEFVGPWCAFCSDLQRFWRSAGAGKQLSEQQAAGCGRAHASGAQNTVFLLCRLVFALTSP